MLLGAPGLRVVVPEPVREITGVRRDVAAFAGIAPRGPVRLPSAPLEPDTDLTSWLAGPVSRSVPVPVSSWEEYRLHFGGFSGPGRLPYAVAAFFAQGGEQAVVVRIVHDHEDATVDAQGRASGQLGSLATTGGDPVVLLARSEGAWGNGLRATLSFATRPVPTLTATTAELVTAPTARIPVGSLLRARSPGDVLELRYVDSARLLPDPVGPGAFLHLTLDVPLAAAPEAFEVVSGRLEVLDTDPTYQRSEVLTDLGFRADHPRWLARVLVEESLLTWPDGAWSGGSVVVEDPLLRPVVLADTGGDGAGAAQMSGGVDRWQLVRPEDFWDATWMPGDEVPGAGVHCLAERDDVGLLLAPDLYEPASLAPLDDVTDPPSLAGSTFGPCLPVEVPPVPEPPPPGLDELALNPLLPADRARIVTNQQALVAFAEVRRDVTVLLDVPPGLPQRTVLAWRNSFDSPYAAAYHPWLDVAAPDDARDSLIRVNPSAFAAGVIAERERRLGVHHGPFNTVVVGAVRPAVAVLPEQHDELHPEGVNVFLAERDGLRLTGGRTLARSYELRQLSVARLMVVLRLSLEREMDWSVFEPSNPGLWAEIRRMVHAFLTRLYEAGAFEGATTKEAFFVRCDRSTMTTNDLDNGRLICLVGVAPAEPLEYLVLELARERDSSVRVDTLGARG